MERLIWGPKLAKRVRVCSICYTASQRSRREKMAMYIEGLHAIAATLCQFVEYDIAAPIVWIMTSANNARPCRYIQRHISSIKSAFQPHSSAIRGSLSQYGIQESQVV